MKRSKLVFGALSATFSALLYLMINEVFGFFVLTIFLSLVVFVLLFAALTTSRLVFKVAFLAGISILILINGGLLLGSFEALEISPTSFINLSTGSIIFRIRNAGLSHIDIRTLTIGEITYNFTQTQIRAFKEGLPLETGDYSLLIVECACGFFEYGKASPEGSYSESYYKVRIVASDKLTPFTFYSESYYPCVVRTRFAEYHSLIERKTSLVENLDILHAEAITTNGNAEISFKLRNTETSLYIYSIKIGNLTLKFNPFIAIYQATKIWFHIYPDGRMKLMAPSSSGYSVNVQAEPTYNSSMFSAYGSYEVIFWTLANRKYYSNVTFT